MSSNLSKFVNGYTTAEKVIQALATEMTMGGVNDVWPWELVFPADVLSITNSALLKTTVSKGGNHQDVYIELYKPDTVTYFKSTAPTTPVVITNQHNIKCRFGTNCNLYRVLLTDPVGPANGDAYVREGDGMLRTYNGTAWSGKVLDNKSIIKDPTNNKVYQFIGGTVSELQPVEVGPTLPLTAGKVAGNKFVDSDDGKLYTFAGSSWGTGVVQAIGTMFYNGTAYYSVIPNGATAVKLDAGSPMTLPWSTYGVSEWAEWSWFKRDTDANIQGWLPVTYWLRVTADSMSCVLMGDPNADFEKYLISFGYFGAINSFDLADDDVSGNFAMTVSNDEVPTYTQKYGDKTANGLTDIAMLKTRSGFPFQTHVLSMTTPDEFVDKLILGPSSWTHKYHMSPAYVFHGVDGYRGELKDVIVTSRDSIVHLDQLVINKGSVDPLKPERVYQYFAINAAYSMFNNSANVGFGVAIMRTQITV